MPKSKGPELFPFNVKVHIDEETYYAISDIDGRLTRQLGLERSPFTFAQLARMAIRNYRDNLLADEQSEIS